MYHFNRVEEKKFYKAGVYQNLTTSEPWTSLGLQLQHLIMVSSNDILIDAAFMLFQYENMNQVINHTVKRSRFSFVGS